MSIPTDQAELRDAVRAETMIITEEQRGLFGSPLRDRADRELLPDVAVLASLGCGDPIAKAEPHRVHARAASAIVRATKPGDPVSTSAARPGAWEETITVCCPAGTQDTCCELAAKAECCASATHAPGACGCSASAWRVRV